MLISTMRQFQKIEVPFGGCPYSQPYYLGSILRPLIFEKLPYPKCRWRKRAACPDTLKLGSSCLRDLWATRAGPHVSASLWRARWRLEYTPSHRENEGPEAPRCFGLKYSGLKAFIASYGLQLGLGLK